MGKLKRMDQVRTILETYKETGSLKATARRLCISKNTVRTYVRRLKTIEGGVSEVLKLPESKLISLMYETKSEAPPDREAIFLEQVEGWLKELRRVGVTRHLLWEEYRKTYPEGYGYSQFCERLKRSIGRKDLTLAMEHKPGEVMQVDFAGKPLRWVDVSTGELHECQVLIAVMPHSQQTFAIALPSQKVEDFVHGLNQTLLYFGRLPRIILSDNLKSFVTRSDKYEPKFNDLCVQLSAHYQVDLQAARPRKPKDKASVENMVKTSYTRIYAPLRNEIFHSEVELNAAIIHQLKLHNAKPYQKKEGCRLDVFQQFEWPQMRDLPSDLFEIKKTTKAKVQLNYHVFLGEEKNYYSVPFQEAGKQTTIVYTSKTVEIYIKNQRIAIHDRLYSGSYNYQTKKEHMPSNHVEWKKAQGYDAAYFSRTAAKIGPATDWAIGQVLIARFHQEQSFKSCQGILALGKKYGNDRLELAAKRCLQQSKASYTMLKNILRSNLDQEPLEPDLFTVPKHENIRGPAAYQ